MKHDTSQNGNVLFYILIAVALLAALSFAISQGGRGNINTIGEERARLLAAEIIEYSSNIKNAVTQLKLRGCADNELSFENNFAGGYENTNAPGDNSCNIFNPAGGGIVYRETDESVLDTSFSADGFYQQKVFLGGFRVVDQGSDETELLLYMPFITDQICSALNEELGIILPTQTDIFGGGGGGGTFNGESDDFNPQSTPDLGDEATNIQGKTAFCINFSGSNHYFNILLAR